MTIGAFYRIFTTLFIMAPLLLLTTASAHEKSHKKLGDASSHSAKSETPASETQAYYIANEGIMVQNRDGDKITKIIFDPLFNNTYGQYQPLPPVMRDSLIKGRIPFDHVDAIFISHHHGDHFSPEDMLALLLANPRTKLYAPSQAIDALMALDASKPLKNNPRITSIKLDYGDAPISFETSGLAISAVRIPHAGGEGRRNIENIVYRITLNENSTVMHMGDADPNDSFFAPYENHWALRETNTAFPPYWFFLTPEGRTILSERLRVQHAIGSHVPEAMPDDPGKRNEKYQGYDLFTQPGETRIINP